MAIITAVQTAIYAPFAGGYEAAILKLGFVDVAGVTPSAEVTSFMATAFYLFDIILATAYIVLLPFMDVEKSFRKSMLNYWSEKGCDFGSWRRMD